MTYEKSVKGATKPKLAPPKAKYVEDLLNATTSGEAAVGELFRVLLYRIRDPIWTVVFKSLIISHMLIKDGTKDVALSYLARSGSFKSSHFTHTGVSPMSEQGPNIKNYGQYLVDRIKSYKAVKTDYVRMKYDAAGQGKLRKLSIEKGLLREVESVQTIISSLLKCNFMVKEVDNAITLTAFRLLVSDLLALFQAVNEGVINVLEHYFEMSKPDAERALKIYKTFVEQTNRVISYLSLARSLEHITRLTIPNIKHAPTSLGDSLEEYLADPEFNKNRDQYIERKNSNATDLSQQAAVATTKAENKPLKSALKKNSVGAQAASLMEGSSTQHLPKSYQNPDMLDFFSSITEEPMVFNDIGPRNAQYSSGFQQQMGLPSSAVQQGAGLNPYATYNQSQYTGAQQFQVQPPIQQQSSYQNQPVVAQSTGFADNFTDIMNHPQYAQQSNQTPLSYQSQAISHTNYQPQLFLQSQITPGPNPFSPASSGPYYDQPTPMAPIVTNTLSPQSTGSNPFRKTMNFAPPTQFSSLPIQRTGSNPFARPFISTNSFITPSTTGFNAGNPMVSQNTGNPFSQGRVVSDPYTQRTPQNIMAPNMTGSMMPQQTGSNPFRKSVQANN